MVSKWNFLVLAMCIFVSLRIDGTIIATDDRESFVCYYGLQSVITPTCAHFTDKFVIQLIAMKYGFLPHNETCTNETRGCEYDVSTGRFDIAIQDMLGRQQSDPYRFFASDRRLSEGNCPTSNYSDTLSYMIAYYNCINASKIKEVCSSIFYVSDEIYFWNDGFPDQGAYMDQDMCDCVLDVTSDTLEVVTLYNKMDCSQNLTLRYADNNSSSLYVWNCSKTISKQETTILKDLLYQNLTLTWLNNFDGDNRTGKYWIKLKAINGTIRLKCPMHDKLPDTTTIVFETTPDNSDVTQILKHVPDNTSDGTENHASGQPHNNTYGNDEGKNESNDKPLNLMIIAAGAGGALGLLVIIVVVVVVVRRRNADEDKRIEQRMEIQMKQSSANKLDNRSDKGSSKTLPEIDYDGYVLRELQTKARKDKIRSDQRERSEHHASIEYEQRLQRTGDKKGKRNSNEKRYPKDFEEYERSSREPNEGDDRARGDKKRIKPQKDRLEYERSSRENEGNDDQRRISKQGANIQEELIDNGRRSREIKDRNYRSRSDEQARNRDKENRRRSKESDDRKYQNRYDEQGVKSTQEFVSYERGSRGTRERKTKSDEQGRQPRKVEEFERRSREPNDLQHTIKNDKTERNLRQGSMKCERLSKEIHDRIANSRNNE